MFYFVYTEEYRKILQIKWIVYEKKGRYVAVTGIEQPDERIINDDAEYDISVALTDMINASHDDLSE